MYIHMYMHMHTCESILSRSFTYGVASIGEVLAPGSRVVARPPIACLVCICMYVYMYVCMHVCMYVRA